MPTVTVERVEAGREVGALATEQRLMPELGRALLSAVLRAASARARATCLMQCREAKRSAPTKERKRETTRWLVVAGLSQSLADDSAPAGREKWDGVALADHVVPAARLVVAWALREEGVVRRSFGDRTDEQSSSASRRTPKFSRRGIRGKRLQYSTTRSGTGKNAPESPKNDPFDRLHSERCKSLSALSPGDSIAAAVTMTWKKEGVFFQTLPRDARLALLLATLIALDTGHDVRAAALDEGVEREIREAILAARVHVVEEAARLHQEIREETKTALVDAVIGAANHDITAWLLTSEMHRSDGTDRAKASADALRERIGSRRGEIDAAYGSESIAASVAAVHAKTIDVVREAAASAGGLDPETANGVEHVLRSSDGRRALASVLDRLAASPSFQGVDAGAAVQQHWSLVGRQTIEGLQRMFTHSDRWDVAVPITNWRTDASMAASGPIATIGDVQRAWGMNTYRDRPQLDPPRSGIATDSPCVTALNVPARTVEAARDIAVAEAKGAVAAAWFAIRDSSAAFPHEAVLAHSTTSTATKSLYRRGSGLGPLGTIDAQALLEANKVVMQVRASMADPRRQLTVQRIVDAVTFYQRSLAASELHERYVNLWFSLETLFGNLTTDTDEFARAVPIGTRVAYRCAMLWHPGKTFIGLSWGAARWAMTTELQSLYELRCATVHAGQLRPVADDVMLGRFHSVVSNALNLTLAAALRDGLADVEELLAWIEDRYPPSAMIPR